MNKLSQIYVAEQWTVWTHRYCTLEAMYFTDSKYNVHWTMYCCCVVKQKSYFQVCLLRLFPRWVLPRHRPRKGKCRPAPAWGDTNRNHGHQHNQGSHPWLLSQCTMGKLKNGVKSSQLWRIISLWILAQNFPNLAQSCLNSPKTHMNTNI